MENLNFELKTEGKDTFLIIKAKLPASKKDVIASKSGKSLMYASTNGNLNTGLKINGGDLIVGLNAYTKAGK
jgi:hypothetical protein